MNTVLFLISLLVHSFAGNVVSANFGVEQVIYQPVLQTSHFVFPNTLWYELYKTHMIIAMWANLHTQSYDDTNVLHVISHMKDLLSWDVMNILSSSYDKRSVLDHYLNDTDITLMQSDFFSNVYKQDMNILQQELDSCSSAKRVSDSNYVNGLDQYDMQYMQDNLKDSLEFGTCMTENRIELNAKKVISDKLVFYADLLQQKYNYLTLKKDLIVDHFDLIWSSILTDLAWIEKALNSYNF